MSAPDGFRFVVEAATGPEHFDRQNHLNNVAALDLLQSARVKYVTDGLRSDELRARWLEHIVVVRELHVRYESEGFPHQSFRVGVRAVSRTDKAYVLDQILVEAATGRTVVQAWVVMQFVGRETGRVVQIPEWFWSQMEQMEARSMPPVTRAREPWGPRQR